MRPQVIAEALDAIFAETAPVLHRRDGKLGFVELNPVYSCVDLNSNDGLQVFSPHRIVAIHRVAVVVSVGNLDPVGVARAAVDVARATFFEEVRDLLSVAVVQAPGEIALERAPQPWVAVLREFAQPHPARLAGLDLVEGEDPALGLVQLDRELPALHLEHDPVDFDAARAAGGAEDVTLDEI